VILKIDENIKDFTITGLSKTSFIRCSKIFTINPSMVESIIGDLPETLNIELDIILTNHLLIDYDHNKN
jgi:hypothetical protein